MAISDRIREQSPAVITDDSQTDSESTTLVVVDPLARRVTGLLRELLVLFSTMQNKDWLTRQMSIIIEAICEEIEEDSTIFSGATAAGWMVQFSELMRWTGTGDYSQLPPELVNIARKIDGKPLLVKEELDAAH